MLSSFKAVNPAISSVCAWLPCIQRWYVFVSILVILIVMQIICGFYKDPMLLREGMPVWTMIICHDKSYFCYVL